MKNVVFVSCFLVIGALLWIMHSSSTDFHKKLLKKEADFRDSILQNIASLRAQRTEIEAEISELKQHITVQAADIRNQIKKIKIVDVPPIDYSKFTDSALVQRLLSDYPNR